jgi:hypothetical protein
LWKRIGAGSSGQNLSSEGIKGLAITHAAEWQ